MTTEYKTSVKIGPTDNALIHLIIRRENHLFVDKTTLRILNGAVEGEGQSGDDYWYNLIAGIEMLLARYPEQPDPALLGLEAPWRPLGDKAADAILSRYYTEEGGTFRVSMAGNGAGATMLFAAGSASVSIPIAPSEATKAVAEVNSLQNICDFADKSGKSPDDTARDIKTAALAAGTMTAIGKATFDCTAAALSDGLDVKSALSCAGDIATTVGGFAGMVADAQARAAAAQKDRESHEHGFERCGEPIDGNKVDIDRVERGMRTG